MNPFRVEKNKIVWTKGGEIVWAQPWGEDAVRIRATRGREIVEQSWPMNEVKTTKPKTDANTEGAVLVNGNLRAEISSGGRIRFCRSSDGKLLLEEMPMRLSIFENRALKIKSLSSDLFRLEVRFLAQEGEKFYGLGQHQHGRLDQKGCVIELAHENTAIAIPFALSSRGYGFIWNNPAVGRVELAVNGTCWAANASRQIDYIVIAGDSPAEIMSRYADITGYSPPLPEWAAGFWQCKLRYRTQEELLNVAREYKRRGLPLSVIVIDFFHWTKMGDWKFDPACWPDPKAMVEELADMGVRVMVSFWPTVNPSSENFEEMSERGLLVRAERGSAGFKPYQDTGESGMPSMHLYDPTNPEARRYVWEKIRENYYRFGIKVFWLDACEPTMMPYDRDNQRYHLGNGEEVGCLYPLMNQLTFYDGMRGEGEQDVVTLCRSAWLGSQRYGAAVWSGDILSTFEVLAEQVKAGLNMAMSGIPWWTTDIGGFFDGDPDDPKFRELVVRWFQYGVFCPLFRLHGFRTAPDYKRPDDIESFTGKDNEAWSFGNEAYGIICEILHMRERLKPYILEQMQKAHESGLPPMRPLFFDFPGDETCWSVEDEFLFGPDILIAPVLEAGARSREVYLPEGVNWVCAWTDEKLKGGQKVKAEAPLDRIPLYLRGGRKLPIRKQS